MAIVLVVDDRASNRELVRTLLGYGGHQVIEAHEGAEALDLAHSRHPDVVLTDILMPGMDGYELARELRAAPDTAATPIVFYTANYLEAETRPFAEACGVSRVLLKSADPRILMQTIDDVLAEERISGALVDTTRTDHEYLRAVSAKLFDKTKALGDTELRFRLMADSSPVGIAFGDERGAANYINTRLTEITGLPAADLLGLGWLRCASEQDREEILTVAGGLGSGDVHHRYRNRILMPDDTQRWLSVHVRAVRTADGEHAGFIGTVDDVTSVVEADQQRRTAERMRDVQARERATERLQSLSTLAGGVAHDFNNILGSILAYQTFVTECVTELTTTGRVDADTGRGLLSDLEQIRKGGQRAADLTQQLLTFGSRKVITSLPFDLNGAIRESNDLLAPTIGPQVRLVTHLAPDLRAVLAEPVNIAQILLNLTANANDAMPAGGTLTIATSNLDILDDSSEAGATPAGRYARLTVRDTGAGMTPETLQRAVEPFFTTKGHGAGSGLGLATVYGIVNQLGGVLRIRSAPGRGAAVSIYLPTTDEPVAVGTGDPMPAGGTETVLIAEDEDGIRETLTRTLSAAGYTVLAAASGAEALDLADRHVGAIQLLLSDVMMPGMLGDELAAGLLRRRPDTTVLFMSGHVGDLIDRYGLLDPALTVLSKPFTKAQVLLAIRAALGAPRR